METQPPAASPNEIVLDGEAEYRGVFGEGDDVMRTVAIRNDGKTPVRVRVLATSCGCLKAHLDIERLECGKEAKLQLSTSATAGPGAIQSQWAALGVFTDGATEPVLLERVPLSYRAARDWRVVPGVLTGIAPIGIEITMEAYVQSSSDTSIDGVTVGVSDVHGFTGHAEQVAPALWRVTLTGKVDSLTEVRGSLPIDIKYEHGTKVRIPVTLRGMNSVLFEPPGLLMEVPTAPAAHHVRFEFTGSPRENLQGRLVPDCPSLHLQAEAANAFKLTLDSELATNYGGALEIRSSDGALLGRMPIAVVAPSTRPRPLAP